MCPHCNQEYNVEDNFLKLEVTCTVCNQNFTVNKAKFCADCGTVNPAQAFKCRQCATDFPLPQTKTVIEASQNVAPVSQHEEQRVSSAELISPFEKFSIRAAFLIIAMIFFFLPTIGCIYFAIFFFSPMSSELPGKETIVFCVFSLVAWFLAFPAATLLYQVTNAEKKIYLTPYRKISLLVSLPIGGILSVGFLIQSMGVWTGEGAVTIVLSLAAIYGTCVGWKWIKIRAEEDVDYEQRAEALRKERFVTMIRIADCFGLATFVPFLGLPFMIPAFAIALYVKLKGGKDYIKTMILVGIGVIINILVFLFFKYR